MENTVDQAAQETPIACTLSAAELAARGDDVQQLIAQATETRELADGYALSYPGTAEWGATLLEFIRFERECCQFFTFELRFEPALGPIWLSIRGAEGVKEMLAAGFMA